MEFNKNQLKAINHFKGNCCVLASAGSGKTSVLTNRIANLINTYKVKPENILAITFSVKARENMQDRLIKLIGDDVDKVTIETFHALGNKILKESKYKYFHNKIKQWQQKQFINNIVVKNLKMEVYEKDVPTNSILSFISYHKNNLIDYDDVKSVSCTPYGLNIMIDIYRLYELTKKNEKLMDFDDMLLNTYRLLNENDSEREKYQDRYQFILVDEFQDTNLAQYEILRLLGKKHNNVFVVGDPLQCLLPNTLISTPNGNMKIKDIQQNDKIIVACGRSKKVETEVSSILNKHYNGKIIKITTNNGNILEGTPQHCIFTKQLPKEGLHYVYLMYKKDYGYRIGITSALRTGSNRNKVNGYELRLTQEQADRLWVLETCDTMEDAMYHESYYSCKYGIPQNVFLTHSEKGLNQDSINKLFKNINTIENVKQLMKDKLLFEDIPYHTQAGGINKKRINFTMFDHTSLSKCNYLIDRSKNNKKYIHRHGITIDTSNKEFLEQVNNFLKPVHKRNTVGYDYFRFTKHNFDYDYLFELVHSIKSKCEENGVDDVIINFNAKITDTLYKFTPMSYARKGMTIPIESENGIIDDEIESVEIYDYDGLVYDINVDYYRNYIANGIVVHNCIYEWNLANNDLLIDFYKDWIDTTVIPLNINYRSSQDIVEISNKLVRNTKETTHNNYYESIADKPKYKHPNFIYSTDEFDESEQIVKKILKIKSTGNNFSDFAILTRTNFQTQAIEKGLYENNIPYEVVGGNMFYELKEIKDMITYLRLVDNTDNDEAFKQVFNSPNRYLGTVFLDEVSTYAEKYNMSLFNSMLSFPRSNEWRYKKGINELYSIIFKIRKRKKYHVGDLIDIIRKDLDYDKYILKEDVEGNIKSEKIDNLDALVTLANKYTKISDFLDEVDSLLGFSKNLDVPDKVKVMTIHKSKGLEFPIVFVVGLNDGILPHAKSNNLNEERRLFYVALTRAEKELYISSTMFYRDRDMEISDFVYRIFDKDYIKNQII